MEDNIFNAIMPANEKCKRIEKEETFATLPSPPSPLPPEPEKHLPPSDPDARDENGKLLRHQDPRPDIAADHALWVMILNNAAMLSGMDQFYGVLHFLRCSGASLERSDKFGFKLSAGKHWDAAAAGRDWDQVRQEFLAPNHQRIVDLFGFTAAQGELPGPAEVFGAGEAAAAAGAIQAGRQERMIFA